MRILYQARQSGKTKKLIERALKTDGIIVCYSERQKKNIMELAKKMQVPIGIPYVANTYNKLANLVEYNKGCKRPLLLDDAEYILNNLFGGYVDTITMSNEDNGGNSNE